MTDEITVQLFGAFRDYDPSGKTEIAYRDNMTALDIKESLIKRLGGGASLERLISMSALADDETIYRDDAPIEKNKTLAILPPVAGG